MSKQFALSLLLCFCSIFIISCCNKEVPIAAYKLKWKTIRPEKSDITRFEVLIGSEKASQRINSEISIDLYKYSSVDINNRMITFSIVYYKVSKEKLDNFSKEKILADFIQQFTTPLKVWDKKKVVFKSKNAVQFYSKLKRMKTHSINKVVFIKNTVYVLSLNTQQGEIGNLIDVANYFFDSFKFE